MRARDLVAACLVSLLAGNAAAEGSVPDVDLLSGAAPPAEPKPPKPTSGADLRLVVTGGLSGLREGHEAFWETSVFRASGLPLRVFDATARAFRVGDTLFFAAEGRLEERALVAARSAPVASRAPRRVLLGPSAIAVTPGEDLAAGRSMTLGRSLAAVAREAVLERREVEGRALFALDLDVTTPLVWPDEVTPLSRVPAVHARLGGEPGEPGVPFLLFARQKGGVARTLGIVDGLLGDATAPPTAFLDVGGALTDANDSSSETARAVRELLLARRPVALAAGSAELTALQGDAQILADAPYLLAARWKAEQEGRAALPPSARRVAVGDKSVVVIALGELPDDARALLPPAAEALAPGVTLDDAARRGAAEHADLVLGVASSPGGVEAALTSSSLDGVLHLAASGLAALPAVDDIDLRENHRTGLHAGPGLARVSAADVTEVYYWFDATGRVGRMRLVRHPVVDDGAEAADAVAAVQARQQRDRKRGSGLPARQGLQDDDKKAWTAADLDHLLGGLVRGETGAELAVLDALPPPVPVEGPVPAPLAERWLSTRDRAVVLELRGAQLAPVLDLAAGRLAGRLVVTGGDLGRRTVAQRSVLPLERYRVALSERALVLLKEAGLSLAVPDEARVAAPRIADVVADRLTDELDGSGATHLLAGHKGVPAHAFFFELVDAAASLSLHTLSGAETFGAVRDARLQTPDNISVGINGRATLAYEGPWAGAALIGTTQLARTTLKEPDGGEVVQKLRDMILVEADARLPLPRLLRSDPLYTPQPGVRLAYQSEWLPGEGTDKEGNVVQLPRRSELRGFVGATWAPAPFLKEVRAGLVVQNDFARERAGALAWGGEAAVAGEWPAGNVKLKLDAFARGFMPDAKTDTAEDVGFVMQAIGRVELPTFLDLSLAAFSDLYVVSGRLPETRGPAVSIIFGAQLSYGNRLKWLPLP